MYAYTKDEAGRWVPGAIVDRREMLRVKLKSIAEEARIIRKEERRTHGYLRDQLRLHRVGTVRRVARNTCIAYGLIRGLSYSQIEPKCDMSDHTRVPNWEEVNRMIVQYGSVEDGKAAKAFGKQPIDLLHRAVAQAA